MRKAFSVAFLFQGDLKLPPPSTEWNDPFYIFGRGVKQSGGHTDLQNVEILSFPQIDPLNTSICWAWVINFHPLATPKAYNGMLGVG